MKKNWRLSVGCFGNSEGSHKFHISMQMNFVSRTFETYCSNKNLKTTTDNHEKLRTEGYIPLFPCTNSNNHTNIIQNG